MIISTEGRSTNLQLLSVLDKWTKDLDDGGQIDVIYTDFEKALILAAESCLNDSLLSCVKTAEKYLANISAFSLSSVTVTSFPC